MVSLSTLWLPILLSAVLVFVVSSLIHMALGYHRTDYGPVPAEDPLMDDLRRANLPPGDYVVPFASSPKEMNEPEYKEKVSRGPVVFFTVMPSGHSSMGKSLALWFLYTLFVSYVAAYIAARALPPGIDYLEVFRFAGTTAFVAYFTSTWQQSIWYGKSWGATARSSFDGLIYALITGGIFGWLWPGT